MPPAVVDSSAVLALSLRGDPRHADVARAVAAHVGTLHLPDPVLLESSQLIAKRLGPSSEAAFIAGFARSPWRRVATTDGDLDRVVELIRRYADARLGFVDAAIVAIAERLAVTRIYTLDRRDFTLVRPRHVEAFEILP